MLQWVAVTEFSPSAKNHYQMTIIILPLNISVNVAETGSAPISLQR